ncbi:MAG: hypothetical protein Q9222_006560 [Ikaeria aurantiellina]
MTATTHLSSSISDRRPDRQSHRRRPRRASNDPDPQSAARYTTPECRPNAEDLRRMRTEFYSTPPEDRRRISVRPAMTEKINPRKRSSVKTASAQPSEVTVREVRKAHTSEHRHRRRKHRVPEEDDNDQPDFVYRTSSPVPNTPRLRRSETVGGGATSIHSRPKDMRRTGDGLERSRTEKRNTYRREDEITVKRIIRPERFPESEDVNLIQDRRQSRRRSASTRDRPSVPPSRPPIIRSQTTTRKVRPPPPPAYTTPASPPTRSNVEASPSVTRGSRRSSGVWDAIRGIPKAARPPEKMYESPYRINFTSSG